MKEIINQGSFQEVPPILQNGKPENIKQLSAELERYQAQLDKGFALDRYFGIDIDYPKIASEITKLFDDPNYKSEYFNDYFQGLTVVRNAAYYLALSGKLKPCDEMSIPESEKARMYKRRADSLLKRMRENIGESSNWIAETEKELIRYYSEFDSGNFSNEAVAWHKIHSLEKADDDNLILFARISDDPVFLSKKEKENLNPTLH